MSGLPDTAKARNKIEILKSQFFANLVKVYTVANLQISLLETIEKRFDPAALRAMAETFLKERYKFSANKARDRIAHERKIKKIAAKLLQQRNEMIQALKTVQALMKSLLKESLGDDCEYILATFTAQELLYERFKSGDDINDAEERRQLYADIEARLQRVVPYTLSAEQQGYVDATADPVKRAHLKVQLGFQKMPHFRTEAVIAALQQAPADLFDRLAAIIDQSEFQRAVVAALLTEYEFKAVLNKTEVTSKDRVGNYKQLIFDAFSQVALFQEILDKFAVLPEKDQKDLKPLRAFFQRLITNSDLALRGIVEDVAGPTLKAKRKITKEKWDYMASTLESDIANKVNLSEPNNKSTFKLQKTADRLFVQEQIINKKQPEEGVVQVESSTTSITTTLPQQWFKERQPLDPQKIALVNALIAQMGDLAQYTEVTISNCYKIPDVAIMLHQMVTDAGLKAVYANDGTSKAVKAFKAAAAPKRPSRMSRVSTRTRT
jgi:hypothetical protein